MLAPLALAAMEAQQDLALVPQKIQAATRRTETCWAVLEPAVRPDQMAQATLPAAVNPPTAVLVARPIMAAGEQVVLEAPVPEQRAVPDQQALSTIRLQLSDRAAAVVAGLAQCHPRLATEALAACGAWFERCKFIIRKFRHLDRRRQRRQHA